MKALAWALPVGLAAGCGDDRGRRDLLGLVDQSRQRLHVHQLARISGELDGDALSGRIEYRAADNNNLDCAPISGCLTYQDFNGTRPPT